MPFNDRIERLKLQKLHISPNHRVLIQDDGTPFFYLGDTAWELFHRLTCDEAQIYLQNRAAKGFTVIQAVVLAELDGLNTPNPNGHVPLHAHDPTRPNEAYFQHVDAIVDLAQQAGLYVGMLPTWGDKVDRQWGIGPEIFTPDNAQIYGEYLGQRYRDKPIIWILGGDRDPKTEQHLAIWRSMAAGLQQGDGGNHLITFHCQTNSATWFHDDDWLSFNLCQSGHAAKNLPNYQITAQNYNRLPPKPTLDGEPRYEEIPVRFWELNLPGRNWRSLPIIKQLRQYRRGWFDAYDARQAAYWSLLAGAMGHTYGHNSVWQMWQPGRAAAVPTRSSWQVAIDYPGAVQMGYVRRLFESRPFAQLVPDQAMVVEPRHGANYTSAARAADGSFALVYLPTGLPTAIDLKSMSGTHLLAHWFDPRTGTAVAIEPQISHRFNSVHHFIPPSHGRDWVLVLDDASCEFPIPG